jgi:hypothetical protein
MYYYWAKKIITDFIVANITNNPANQKQQACLLDLQSLFSIPKSFLC